MTRALNNTQRRAITEFVEEHEDIAWDLRSTTHGGAGSIKSVMIGFLTELAARGELIENGEHYILVMKKL